MKADTRPEDGVIYWAYILIYVDNIIYVHHGTGTPLAKLYENFKMKEGSIQVPTFYLRAKLNKTVLPDGVVAWGIISSKCVQYTVHNVQEYLAAFPDGKMLPKKSPAPFTGGYKPELDERPELDPVMANFFQSQLGILRSWGAYIITEVSMLSTYLCLSREGKLETVYHVFAYLSKC
jgi:hypothetical protein